MHYYLQNKYLQAKFSAHGAELCSLKEKASDTEYIWQGDPQHWARHAPVLFPIVGKLKHNQYTLDSTVYALGQHGFARDCLFDMVQKESDQIVFRLQYNQMTLAHYPYKFILEIRYRLLNTSLEVNFKVINIDDKPIYFSIGAHPAFNCPLTPTYSRNSHYLRFNADENSASLQLSDGLISDQLCDVFDTPRRIQLHDSLFDNDALVFRGLHSTSVTLVREPDEKILSVEFEGFPYLGVWSKSATSNFICIEPWYGLADSANGQFDFAQKEGIQRLEQDAQFDCHFRIIIH